MMTAASAPRTVDMIVRLVTTDPPIVWCPLRGPPIVHQKDTLMFEGARSDVADRPGEAEFDAG